MTMTPLVVVNPAYEGREHQAEQHHHQQRLRLRLPRYPPDELAQRVDHAGSLQCAGQHEEGADGERSGVAEHLQHVRRAHDAERQQQRGAAQREHVWRDDLANHAEEDDRDDREHDDDLDRLPVHVHFLQVLAFSTGGGRIPFLDSTVRSLGAGFPSRPRSRPPVRSRRTGTLAATASAAKA
jgi:hypothetical protein